MSTQPWVHPIFPFNTLLNLKGWIVDGRDDRGSNSRSKESVQPVLEPRQKNEEGESSEAFLGGNNMEGVVKRHWHMDKIYVYIVYRHKLASPAPPGPTFSECFSTLSPRQGDMTIRCSLMWSAYLYVYMLTPPKPLLFNPVDLTYLHWSDVTCCRKVRIVSVNIGPPGS